MRIEKVEGASETGRERILAQLNAQAEGAGHPFGSEQVLFEAWEGDVWLGGLQAKWGTQWVFVELLAVAETVRGQGIGRRLLEEVEHAAERRGMIGIWLDTFSFQAPEFYRGMGYVELGRIQDYALGKDRIFFAKRLPTR